MILYKLISMGGRIEKADLQKGYRMKQSSQMIKKYTAVAVFSALAYVCTLTVHIEVAGFLTFDMKDAVITVGGMFFGPAAATVSSLITCLLELSISHTGPYGFIMNLASSTVFALIPSLMYKYRRRLGMAVTGLVAGVIAMTSVMMLLNILITPIYTGADRATVIAMIPTVLLPFNLVKGITNASITMLLYKPVSRALHATGFFGAHRNTGSVNVNDNKTDAGEMNLGEKSGKGKKSSLIPSIVVTALSLVICAGCIAVFIVVLKGAVMP